MPNFITQVDFSTQIKQYQNTEGSLSGSVNINQYTILGTDYIDLPLGLDSTTTGITVTYSPIINGYFTGTTGSTTFYFNDPNMDIAGPNFSAITASNSGLTQYADAFQPIYTTIVDGNSFDVYYSGVSFDMTPVNLDEYIPGEFSGVTFTNTLNYVSGTTYPWWFLKSGSTTWNEVKGRLQTDRITITESASTGYVLTCLDSDGNAVWLPASSAIFTGGTGSCITDLYVSNIHSCSPLNINPLDEGNVYFSSTSGLTFDVTNKRLGLNQPNPQYTFDFNSKDGNTLFYYNDVIPSTQNIVISGNSSVLTSMVVASRLSSVPATIGLNVGLVGENSTLYPGYGNPLDAFIYASSDTNRLNIVSAPRTLVGANTDDIRFYAGQFVNSGFGSDMHIQGRSSGGSIRGYVGIGTEVPQSKLDVNGKTRTSELQVTTSPVNGYVLTSDVNGNATWQAPTSGGMFTGNTSASCITDLYVTNVHGCSPITVWDSVQSNGSQSTGATSFAFGSNTSALGDYSHAEGRTTMAIGLYSHAEGSSSQSIGEASHAEGQTTIAIGQASHSEGLSTTAQGIYSHAEGNGSISIGQQSHSEGQGTTASGNSSHAEGYLTTAIGYSSHAEGGYFDGINSFSGGIAIGWASHAEGVQTTVIGDWGSHAEGWLTTAIGNNSHAEGFASTAQGNGSHAEGGDSFLGTPLGEGGFAFGVASHAEGLRTTASGDVSHTEGWLTTAIGVASHAEGYQTTASGYTSHSGGYQTKAIGNYSFVHGLNSVANVSSTIVLGNNITGNTSNYTYVDGLNIKTVGAGPSTIDIGVDANGFVVNVASDISLKENIEVINSALDKIKNLRGVYYTWKDKESGGSDRKIGFIAQEVEPIVPELVYTHNDGLKVVQYKDVTALLVEAVKELSTGISINVTSVPLNASDPIGEIGSISYDDNFLYVKTAKNGGLWGRVSLDTSW